MLEDELRTAAAVGVLDDVLTLLQRGADFAPDSVGRSALQIAATGGHVEVVNILLKCGANPNIRDNLNGDTALHIAAAMGRRKLTTILLEAGCDKTIRNKRACSSSVRWSPYGCHYYPDPSSFPQPKLDSLPGEPLSKGEQYYLDLAGNIRKGPVGVGLTCYCANFLRDMETRLERNNLELKHRIKLTRQQLEDRVERTEGLLSEMLQTRGRSEKKEKRKGRDKDNREMRQKRSHSVDLLQNTPTVDKGTTSNSSRKSTPILPPPPDPEEMAQVEARLKELSVRAEAIEKTEWLLAATAAASSSVSAPSAVAPSSSTPVVYAPPRSRLALYDPHPPSFECLSGRF
ncbi:unnamed protein product [Nesidiocoris tenuis]|uniref:Uncharacterized protein n=1 Tax=Nesidiocoris tenuis TaxID=355587 RepID=A0A6H5HJT6_9HEMI|nr:unnamed protein product [Nesidiocoris tenuis]